MTLALTGGWAWAELSDPPPGEPGQPPPGEPGQPPPGGPPPPPSGDTGAPLPPLPGGGATSMPPRWIPPWFSWSGASPLFAVWDADLKLTDADPDNRSSSCNVYESGTTRDRWPFATVYDSASNAYTHADPNTWALNDPARTYDLMTLNNINLYLHDARAGLAVGYLENSFYRCDWVSLAALNDHIEAVEGVIKNTFTGLVLGRLSPTQVLSTGFQIEDRLPIATDVNFCYYRDWIGRARAEAAEHSHHKLVLVDELTHSLRSPFSIFDGQLNPWTPEDVAVLRRLATEEDAAAVDSQRRACDAIWSPILGDTAASEGWVPPVESDQAPVELWAKVNAATVPLFHCSLYQA